LEAGNEDASPGRAEKRFTDFLGVQAGGRLSWLSIRQTSVPRSAAVNRSLAIAVAFLTTAFLSGKAVSRGAGQDARANAVLGTWELSYVLGGIQETSVALVKLDEQAGKVTGTLVAPSPRMPKLTLKSVARDGDLVRITFQNLTATWSFEARIPARDGKRMLGSLTVGTGVYPATLTATSKDMLDEKTLTRTLDCPPLVQLRALSQKSLLLRVQAQRTKDAEQKKDLLEQAAQADKTAREQAPALYREVLAKHPDSPAVFTAAPALVRSALTGDATPEEVKRWATTAVETAQAYGPRFQGEIAGQLATTLVNQPGQERLAATLAGEARKSLRPDATPSERSRVLGVLARALRKAGADDKAKAVDAELAKLEEELDREYHATMPGFKGTPFAGRKGGSDRAVFMELFTGATCPPCVAADLAFDVLMKSYQPRELVLVQYHVHIPGPDPLTNADTEARWKYYTKAFPKEVRGVPSSVFNGKPAAGGGGGVANAEKKYDAYRQVIDPLLDEPACVKLAVQARRQGDRIDVHVEVAGLAIPGSHTKLRILLAEETVRYAGSNKIRFHHQVVRAFPGGVEGLPLTAADSKHSAAVDLAELRGQLTKYLDDFEAKGRSFANPARPLDFHNLRIIAFVQNDETHEVLQAAQVEVK
jgi:hypothetical protein